MANDGILIYKPIWFADALTDEQRDAEVKALEEKRRRNDAIVRLWKHAISELRVRHPDPRVDVNPRLEIGFPGLTIRFAMTHLRDTSDPDVVVRNFGHIMEFDYQWPGYDVAHAYLTAGWVLYMMHEGMELVTFRGPLWPHDIERGTRRPTLKNSETMVVNAHDSSGTHQRAIARGGMSNLAATIDWALGLGKGQQLIDWNANRAANELAAEIEPWIPGT
jgi:hypothetical protein